MRLIHLTGSLILIMVTGLPLLARSGAGDLILNRSGDYAMVPLERYVRDLAEAAGASAVLRVTNSSTLALPVARTWRKGQTLGQALTDFVRLYGALDFVAERKSIILVDAAHPPATQTRPAPVSLQHHVLELGTRSGLAGGLVLNDRLDHSRLLAPPVRLTNLVLGEALDDFCRFYGIFGNTIGKEAFTIYSLAPGKTFDKPVPDREPSLFAKGNILFTLGINITIEVPQLALDTSPDLWQDARLGPGLALGLYWALADHWLLSYTLGTTKLTDVTTSATGSLITHLLGGHYAFSIGYLQLSAGGGILLRTLSADTLRIRTESGDEFSTLPGLFATLRIWVNLFSDLILSGDFTMGTSGLRTATLGFGWCFGR